MITHIMKDGTVKKDITGHVVKADDVPPVYMLMEGRSAKTGDSAETVSRTGISDSTDGMC